MPESDLWINSCGTPKFWMISIRERLHPLFSWESSLRIKILFHFIILGFFFSLRVLSILVYPLNLGFYHKTLSIHNFCIPHPILKCSMNLQISHQGRYDSFPMYELCSKKLHFHPKPPQNNEYWTCFVKLLFMIFFYYL